MARRVMVVTDRLWEANSRPHGNGIIPNDALVVEASYDHLRQVARIVLESEEFRGEAEEKR